jgi:hypothetical protein
MKSGCPLFYLPDTAKRGASGPLIVNYAIARIDDLTSGDLDCN